MKTARLLIILFILMCSHRAFAEIEIFSLDKISTNPHAALLRSPSVSVLYTYSTERKKHYMYFDFGAKIPAISYYGDKSFYFDIGGFGAIFTRFELFSESFNFIHADFMGGLFFDFRYKSVIFETQVFHVSSHLGDDYIKYDFGIVKNTGFESVKQYVSYTAEIFDLTAGIEYKLLRRPWSKIFYDVSFFLGGRVDLMGRGIPLFFECEVEVLAGNYLPNVGVRIGIYLHYLFNNVMLKKSNTARQHHEFSIYYYYGYAKAGSFYDRRESLIMAGPTSRY